jgi:hypothetical protein
LRAHGIDNVLYALTSARWQRNFRDGAAADQGLDLRVGHRRGGGQRQAQVLFELQRAKVPTSFDEVGIVWGTLSGLHAASESAHAGAFRLPGTG